jgi:addiction module HigA family antidote
MKRNRRPTEPGTILKSYFLSERGVSIAQFARATGLSRKHVSNIVHGKAAITTESACRFARVLDTSPEFWMNLQNAVDLYDASKKLAKWEPAEIHPAALAV